MDKPSSLTTDQILEVLSLSHNATAVYTTEDIVIQSANDAMIAFWGKDRSIIGKPLEEAVPELKGQPFKTMLQEVLRTGITNTGLAIPAELMIDGKIQTSYYDYEYRAIKNTAGQTYCILHTAADVTERELNRVALQKSIEQEAAKTRALIENERNLRLVIMQAPVSIAIFRGDDYKVEVVNSRGLELWGRTETEVISKPILTAMPELESQGIKKLLDDVYKTGKPFSATELPIQLLRNGQMETAYINFVYEPLHDSDGLINGLITIGFEVTLQVLARKQIEQSQAEQFSLNEELTAANEELISTNEELAEIQDSLESLVKNLATSESRFRLLVKNAPVAIGILKDRELIIESANDQMLKIWGKNYKILGKPLATALPELHGQPFLQILDDVFTSGKAYYGYEAPVTIEHEGVLIESFFDFIYQPLHDGSSNTIMVVAVEVTDKVRSRKAIEWSEEQLRLAIDSANLATWYLNTDTLEFFPSPKLKELFGYYPDEDMPLSAGIDQITEEFRDKVSDAVQATITTGADYDLEYSVIGFHDQKLRWLKAMGKLYKNSDEQSNFFGVIADITESKQDELRKNDFIGMVSHELKTPLTSLSAIIQVSNSKLKNNSDSFLAGAMEKANLQVKKMSNMVNGFLNISRLESGKILIVKQEFRLDELLKEMIQEMQLVSAEHIFYFEKYAPITIDADRDKIGSVISNLLSNAVKYSPKGQHIFITCQKTGRFVQVSVTDEGMGIKSKDLDKLFDRYYRVETKHTAHISGFGIGLYLSAEIIKHHGGEIWAESESGVGSTFYFTLPLK